jgi:hypothetical protein
MKPARIDVEATPLSGLRGHARHRPRSTRAGSMSLSSDTTGRGARRGAVVDVGEPSGSPWRYGINLDRRPSEAIGATRAKATHRRSSAGDACDRAPLASVT